MGDFQGQVYPQQAPAVVGDFCSKNPRASVLAGPGGLIAGPSGISVGLFAWLDSTYIDANGGALRANNYGSGPVGGFVHREQQGLITTYLAAYGMLVPAGMPVTLMSAGDFWAYNSGSAQAVPGNVAYANYLTGKVTFAATGAATTASATTSTIAAGTAATFTGSINGSVLTASAVSNTIYPGAVLSGGTVATGTVVTDQISGTAGGAGTYSVSIPEQTVASASLTATPYVLDTTGGTVTGTIGIGSTVVSSGTVTGVVVGAGVTAVYATGKYVVATGGGLAASGTVVLASDVQTKWVAMSSGAQGELVKITSWPLG